VIGEVPERLKNADFTNFGTKTANKCISVHKHKHMPRPPLKKAPLHSEKAHSELAHSNLFVACLNPSVTATILEAIFSKHGRVLTVRGNMASPFMFVEMASTSEAQNAMNKLHGRKLMGRRIVVRAAERRCGDVEEKEGGGEKQENEEGTKIKLDEKIERIKAALLEK